MDLGPHVDAIRDDVRALLGSDTAAGAAFEQLGRALEPAVQIRLQDALCEASFELGEQLPAGHTELHVAGRDARLVYVGSQPEVQPAPAEEPEDGGMARITLRLAEALKLRVEEAAAKDGVSVNAWLVRAVQQGIEGRRTAPEIGRSRSGSRITGYAQS